MLQLTPGFSGVTNHKLSCSTDTDNRTLPHSLYAKRKLQITKSNSSPWMQSATAMIRRALKWKGIRLY